MPNYIKNRVKFVGESGELIRVYEFLKDDNGNVNMDFNKVVPMSEELNIQAGSQTSTGLEYFNLIMKREQCLDMKCTTSQIKAIEALPDFEKIKELGKKALSNLAKYGHTTWYDWSIDNWGTKWNAMNVTWENETLVFETAWNHPEPVLVELSNLFPQVQICLEYADEDTGYNCGKVVYQNGEMNKDIPEDGSKEAYEIAFELWGNCEYYRLVGDKYEYIEDEE